MSRTARTNKIPVLMVACVVLVMGIAPALADPIPDVDEYPRTAFVARNDVPFDSLAVGPVAGALGGIVVITPQGSLSASAEDALADFGPDLVIIAGGEAAISAQVEDDIRAAGGWDVERAAGAGRDQTAAEIAAILADLGVDRPALAGDRQIVGDVTIGGSLTVDEIDVASGVDADTLDGQDSDDFLSVDDVDDIRPLIWGQRDDTGSGSATTAEELEVNSLDIEVPTDGVLVISGTVFVRNLDGSQHDFILIPRLNGEETEPNRLTAYTQLGDNDPAELTYTLPVPVSEGSHTVSQDVSTFASSEVEFFHNHETLTVQFVPGGSAEAASAGVTGAEAPAAGPDGSR